MSGVQLGLFGGADLSQPVDRDRWCTPPWVLEVARQALGAIDLDPASNARAQQHVQACEWYSLDVGRDGLALPWSGRVWCNPPYARGLIDLFADKILAEMERGEIDAMIVLVNSSTSAAWWQRLAARAEALVYPDQRLSFWHAETGRTQRGNSYDQTLLVYGLVDLEPLEQLGLVVRKSAPLSEELPPTSLDDDWRDLGRADELAGVSWALLEDLTIGWPGWHQGRPLATGTADERDAQARAVVEALDKAGELVAHLWHRPEPSKPSPHHLKLWELVNEAHDALGRLGARLLLPDERAAPAEEAEQLVTIDACLDLP